MSELESQTVDTTTTSVEAAAPAQDTLATEVKTTSSPKTLDDLKAVGQALADKPTTTTKKEDTKPVVPTTQGAGAATTTPTWAPNWKFKAFDKEYEIEEWARPLIKDADTEEKIKKLHSKAYAMDGMKEKLEKQRVESETFKSTIAPKLKSYDYFDVLVKNKDWDTFFTKLGVPDQELYDLVERKLELAQATPEKRAEYQRQMALKQQSYTQTSQLEELQQAYADQVYQTRMMQLDSTLMRADVSQYAQAWDQRAGQIGAFKQLVIDEAAAIYHQTNGAKDLGAEEAVNHVIQKFGKILSLQQQAQAQQMSVSTPQTNVVQSATTAPVIPTVAGRGTSPVKKVPKSLDDLKKLAAELSAQ